MDDHDGPCPAWARKARWDSVTGRGDSWVLELEQSAVFRRAVDAGINFIDTCDYYSVGNSEEIVGALIAEHGSRSEFVVATKIGNQMDLHASARGYRASRSSRRRSARSGELRTGYIDQRSRLVVYRQFCPNCGFGVTSGAEPGIAIILAGTLDNSSRFNPSVEVFCSRAQAWLRLAGQRRRFPGMPA